MSNPEDILKGTSSSGAEEKTGLPDEGLRKKLSELPIEEQEDIVRNLSILVSEYDFQNHERATQKEIVVAVARVLLFAKRIELYFSSGNLSQEQRDDSFSEISTWPDNLAEDERTDAFNFALGDTSIYDLIDPYIWAHSKK